MKKSVQAATIAMVVLSVLFIGLKIFQSQTLQVHGTVSAQLSETENVFRASENEVPPSQPGAKELIRKLYLGSNTETSDRRVGNSSLSSVPTYSVNFNYTHYAIVSVSTPLDENYNYVFYVPLTILSWRRIGYGTILLISGSKQDWLNQPVLKAVYMYAVKLNASVTFLDSKPENRIMISQVSRLFAASLLQDKLHETDFLIISDIDLWPLNADMYVMNTGNEILSLNSDCCGTFEHNGKRYTMLPMANVGANLTTWLNIIGSDRTLPTNAEDILKYFENEFGSVSRNAVVKGENFGWYQDQRMLSILVQQWIDRNDPSLVQRVPRNVGMDRVDRAWWNANSIVNKTDAHLLENAYDYKVWFRLTPLLRQMYGENSNAFSLCMRYFEDFQKVFTAKIQNLSIDVDYLLM